jgi:spore coat protein CotF
MLKPVLWILSELLKILMSEVLTMITNIKLSTKEKYLLEDARTHEEQCIRKYENYTNLACDSELKAVFRQNGQKEQEHLETINQMLKGTIPQMNSSQGGGQSGGQNTGAQSAQQISSQQATIEQQSSGAVQFKSSDKDLCTDMLMTEKYVSSSYNTAIFEFSNAQIRDVLNHIQTEEQKHGEAIFAYMQSKGMYSVS